MVRFIVSEHLYTVFIRNKEALKMSNKRYNVQLYRPAYPNAADRNYLRQRHLNILTSVVSGIGFFTAMLFFFSL